VVSLAPLDTNPLRVIAGDLRAERAATIPYPPGFHDASAARTRAWAKDPLPVLLDGFERFGPVFSVRVLHALVVFALGPQATHQMLVTHASRLRWREGHMRELWPLLGDGLLIVDGERHRHDRRAMLPLFHTEAVAATGATIAEEVAAAVGTLRPGVRVDLYAWARELALRIALRALLGMSPEHRLADAFERALAFHAEPPWRQVLRGPGTPWARMLRARRELDAVLLAEIAGRRRTGARGADLLSLLLDSGLDDAGVRDEAITLLFAGHDTTTSTVAFLAYELSRAPEVRHDPRFTVEGAVDEVLRLWPPAWVGPRRVAEEVELAGVPVPAGAFCNSCSWATHRLPGVWDDPLAFVPWRDHASVPKGAYVPFGGGSRTCLGMRFGLAEVRAIAAALLERFDLRVPEGFRLAVRQMPTLSPAHGLPVVPVAR
jgi:cytochrome P450